MKAVYTTPEDILRADKEYFALLEADHKKAEEERANRETTYHPILRPYWDSVGMLRES